jgi:hypothetical protein
MRKTGLKNRFPELPYTPGSIPSELTARSMVEPAKNDREKAWRYIYAKGTEGATLRELKDVFGFDGPRVTELGRLGRIRDTGEIRETPSGRPAAIHVAIEPEFWTDKRPGWPAPTKRNTGTAATRRKLALATAALIEIVEKWELGLDMFSAELMADIARQALGELEP